MHVLKGFGMKVDIHQISDSGLSIDYEVRENVSSSYLAKDDEVSARLAGMVSPDSSAGYVFSGNLEINCILVCDKCLNEAAYSSYSDISEKFSKDVSEGRWSINGDELDFTEVIRANICALLPMKILCTDNCQGLCPMCGKNLNEEQCECEKPIDPRFAHLSSFFKEEV